MGEPAELTESDRTFAHLTAMDIYQGVLEDTHEPSAALRQSAEGFAVPPETMLLWLATLVLQYRKERRDFSAAHAFEPKSTSRFEGPRDETCEHCGTDPRNVVHEAPRINAILMPDLVGEAQEVMKRAEEARALYGKPSKATRVRVDRGDFVRVSGMVLCEVCQVCYFDHDPVIGFPWLRHACDGRLIKP